MNWKSFAGNAIGCGIIVACVYGGYSCVSEVGKEMAATKQEHLRIFREAFPEIPLGMPSIGDQFEASKHIVYGRLHELALGIDQEEKFLQDAKGKTFKKLPAGYQESVRIVEERRKLQSGLDADISQNKIRLEQWIEAARDAGYYEIPDEYGAINYDPDHKDSGVEGIAAFFAVAAAWIVTGLALLFL